MNVKVSNGPKRVSHLSSPGPRGSRGPCRVVNSRPASLNPARVQSQPPPNVFIQNHFKPSHLLHQLLHALQNERTPRARHAALVAEPEGLTARRAGNSFFPLQADMDASRPTTRSTRSGSDSSASPMESTSRPTLTSRSSIVGGGGKGCRASASTRGRDERMTGRRGSNKRRRRWRRLGPRVKPHRRGRIGG